MTKLSSYNTPPPYVVTYSTDTGGGPSTEAWRAFDQDVNRGWISQAGDSTPYIQLDWGTGGARILKSYSMWCFAFFSQRYPNTWKIEGSNDLLSWHQLDARAGVTESNWLALRKRRYVYQTSNVAYRYTRLTILSNNGDADFVSLTDWVVSDLGNVNLLY